MTFRDDGTFEMFDLKVLSPTAAGADGIQGTYATSGMTLTLTPTQATCPPQPVQTDTFSLSNGDLDLATSSGVLILAPAPNNELPAGVVTIDYGCFDSSGNFTQTGLGTN